MHGNTRETLGHFMHAGISQTRYIIVHGIMIIPIRTACFTSAVFIILVVTTHSEAVTYWCFPNNSVVIDNPDSSLYHTAMVETTDKVVCDVGWNNNITKVYLVITGCNQNGTLVAYFSSRKTWDGIISGKVAIFSLLCTSVEDGVIGTIIIRQGFTLLASSLRPDSVTPAFMLTSRIYSDLSNKTQVQTAYLGQRLYWFIRGPEEYDNLPVNCTAYPGNEIGGHQSKTFIQKGCSLDPDMASGFKRRDTYGYEIMSYLYAFRFYNSRYIIIDCLVRTCLRGQPNCRLNCFDGKRRRSSFPDEEISENIELLKLHLCVELPNQLTYAGNHGVQDSADTVLKMIYLHLIWTIIIGR